MYPDRTRKPQNTVLDRSAQIELVDVLKNDQSIAVHETADARPPPFELVSGNIFHREGIIEEIGNGADSPGSRDCGSSILRQSTPANFLI